ncbi:MAG: hypothetical protein KatS3mg105_2768 [Gemmatales bacterium]|nr:MAG: hypothetical protein KatS3mg105_2768 [Gemmatales bacterium]
MPGRWMSVTILMFWTASMGWLFYRDVRPKLLPPGSPPFTIDLVDEARTRASSRWHVYIDGTKKGYAETSVGYREHDDTFELRSEYKLWQYRPVRVGAPDFVLKSMYRVDRAGRIQEFVSSLNMQMPHPIAKGQVLTIDGQIAGDVRHGRVAPLVTIRSPLSFEYRLDPVEVEDGASVLNPLQPVNRLRGLRLGQRWRCLLVHPIDEIATKSLQKFIGHSQRSRPRWLEAEVARRTMLDWHDVHVSCLVVHYSGEDVSAQTWVREEDGLVLQQTAAYDGKTSTLVRD